MRGAFQGAGGRAKECRRRQSCEKLCSALGIDNGTLLSVRLTSTLLHRAKVCFFIVGGRDWPSSQQPVVGGNVKSI